MTRRLLDLIVPAEALTWGPLTRPWLIDGVLRVNRPLTVDQVDQLKATWRDHRYVSPTFLTPDSEMVIRSR